MVTLSEFALVNTAAKIFELSSVFALHRDPISGKCKVLPLGRWRRSLQKEDISLPYGWGGAVCKLVDHE